MDDLIEALTIAKKYASDYQLKYPTHCEHDELWLCVDIEKFSTEDSQRMVELGFFISDDCWKSYHFGSC